MHPLSASQLIKIWEESPSKNPAKCALSLLKAALPELTDEQLRQMSIGKRNAYLLKVYEYTFGSVMDCFTTCPRCNSALEFSLNTQAVYKHEEKNNKYNLRTEDFKLRYRLLNNNDLLLASQQSDVEAAKHVLLENCLLQAFYKNKPITMVELPDFIVDRLMENLKKNDPQAEILLNFTCPDCEQQWQGLFDIVKFLWTQIETYAKQLLMEVHRLALAYGWHEADILTMSSKRRHYYLERIS